MSGRLSGIHKTAFYPGTFDPVTLGHLDIIRRSSQLFDQVVIGVAISAEKHPLLALEERVALLEKAVRKLPLADRIKVIGFEGLLIEAMRETGSGTIIRGLRTSGDFDFETQLSGAISRLAPEIETVFLLASEAQRTTASRIVKEIARLGGDISPFVSKEVAAAVLQALCRKPT